VPDPVAFGFVASLARPGANITGLTNYSPELSGKKGRAIQRGVSPDHPHGGSPRPPRQPPDSFKETQIAGQSLALKLQSLEIRNATDVENAFSAMRRERAEAFITLPHAVVTFHPRRILELAEKGRLPSTHSDKLWVDAGGLMSTGRTALTYTAVRPDTLTRF
jgi:putative ABC transport system substrate-binding protein